MCQELAKESKAKRLQVGCLFVRDLQVISEGFNGTYSGCETNECEDSNGKTTEDVNHSEANAILKAAKNGSKLLGSTVYCTHSCCQDCAKKIISVGAKRFVYITEYRDLTGLELLKRRGIEVERIEI